MRLVGSSFVAIPAVLAAAQAYAQIPITDLGAGLYLDQYQGGLYENGSNEPPTDLLNAARNRAVNFIKPRDPTGAISPTGTTVLLSVGFSNGHQEFGGRGSFDYLPHTFMGQAYAHPVTDRKHLVLMNGARGGQDVTQWIDPASTNYSRINTDLTSASMSRLQVQAAWVKLNNRIASNPMPSLPSPNAEAHRLVAQLATVMRNLKSHYPNLSIAFLSSRIYGAIGPTNGAHPEPYAYETAFANKWLIEAQLRQMRTGVIDPVVGNLAPGVAPLIAWGPYTWADGTHPRSDGLVWLPEDFEPDNVHPSPSGEQKVGAMLLDFFRTSPMSQPWFTDPIPGDATLDGRVDFDDLLSLAQQFGSTTRRYWADGDFNGDGRVGFDDLLGLAQNYESPALLESDWALARSLVPEPALLSLLGATACLVVRRRV